MATIYLFRHGQTNYNRDKMFTGWLDSKLTSLGIQQAKDLGNMLKDKKIDIAYQSRLSRSTDTLKEVLKFHPECRQIITDDRIIERSYGDLSGFKHAEIIDIHGVDRFDKWHRGWADIPPHGESFADVEIRVKSFINYLKATYHDQDIGIAISAHGNSIRLFRKIMEKAKIADVVDWTIPYDRYFEYSI